MTDLGIHSDYTLRSWVSLWQQKIQTGLITLPANKKAQTQYIVALKQRNDKLEQALQPANLLILDLNTMIEVDGKDGGARALERANPKKSARPISMVQTSVGV